jgi:hypothetical protein
MRSLETPVFAHWHKLVENFETSPLEFYEAVEAAVRKKEIPELRCSRVEYRESGILSAIRIYHRIHRKRLAFDVCAAPFGNGFFFSSWLTEPKKSYRAVGCLLIFLCLELAYLLVRYMEWHGLFIAAVLVFGALAILVISARGGWLASEDLILGIPYLGPLYEHFFDPDTYFKEDTRNMFQEMAHGAVLEAVDAVLQTKGLRALAPEDRKPAVRSLVK